MKTNYKNMRNFKVLFKILSYLKLAVLLSIIPVAVFMSEPLMTIFWIVCIFVLLNSIRLTYKNTDILERYRSIIKVKINKSWNELKN